MEDSDEKFFEELANEKTNADGEFSAGGACLPDGQGSALGGEIELAKATTGNVVQKPHLEPKTSLGDYDGEPEGQLTIDVYQTPNDIIVESAIAGVKPEDIDINVTNDSVTIKGARRREKEVRDDDYFYQECYWGRFSRSVILPQEVDPESATVNFKNGILTVRLPKLNRKKARKLKVKVE